MERLLNEGNPENTVVRIVLRGKDGTEYECAGVLMKEGEDEIKVGFNAIDDVVKDYLDIKREEIVHIEELDPKEIKKI